MRRADVRRETVHLRRGAWCDICAVAMRRAPWAMGFKRSAARHYFEIGAFGALRCARLPPTSSSRATTWDLFRSVGNGKWEMGVFRVFVKFMTLCLRWEDCETADARQVNFCVAEKERIELCRQICWKKSRIKRRIC